jgi:hypothetical protein
MDKRMNFMEEKVFKLKPMNMEGWEVQKQEV